MYFSNKEIMTYFIQLYYNTILILNNTFNTLVVIVFTSGSTEIGLSYFK